MSVEKAHSEMSKKFEEKLSHLSVLERGNLEKLMNKRPELFSDVARKCSSRMVFHNVEGKKGREKPRKGILFPNVEI